MKSVLLSYILLLLACPVLAQPSATPNIVVILMDDMGYADIGPFGAVGYATPNIEALAKAGMRFTNFYAAQPVCTASRAGLLTGCYPNRIGLVGALHPASNIGLNASELTMAELLKQKNYKTIAIGKWHLGDSKPFLPLQHGFDEYFGVPYSNDMSPIAAEGQKANPRKSQLPLLPLMEGNETLRSISNLDEMGELTSLYTARAVKFIRENKKRPFFLYMPHSMVHVPLAASARFKNKSGKGLFADVLMEIDWSIGEVMKALKECGIEKNTLVVFTSDNGPWLSFGHHAGSAAPLREGKMTNWEGGQRVSCIMRWPGVIPAGKTNDGFSCAIDLLPTFAAVTATQLSANKIDGINILPLLKGETKSPRTQLLYYFKANDLNAIRVGNWKLVFPHTYVTVKAGGKDGGNGKTELATTQLALYDLSTDPGEKMDVKDKHTDIVKQLQQAADEARIDLGDGLTKAKGNNRRPPGRISIGTGVNVED